MTHYPHVRGGLPCKECPNAALRLDEYAEVQGIPGIIDSPNESLYQPHFRWLDVGEFARLVRKAATEVEKWPEWKKHSAGLSSGDKR